MEQDWDPNGRKIIIPNIEESRDWLRRRAIDLCIATYVHTRGVKGIAKSTLPLIAALAYATWQPDHAGAITGVSVAYVAGLGIGGALGHRWHDQRQSLNFWEPPTLKPGRERTEYGINDEPGDWGIDPKEWKE